MRPTIVLCGLLWFPCACGPEKGDDGGEASTSADGTASGTTGGEAPTSDGETGGTATDSASGTGTTAGPDMCAPFEDVTPSPEVTVHLRNRGAASVFLQRVSLCDPLPLFEMAGPDADTPVTWMRGSCAFTCSEAIDGSCGCPAFCAEDAVLMIAPGGTHTLTWSGASYGQAALPQACATDVCGPQCLVQQQAADGTYTLRARGATAAAACADPNACTCTPNAEGWCDVPASSLGAEPVLATASLEYPGATEVELVFGDP
jgi:hypothetical protein